MRRVIINADDFGLTDGVCAGIVRCLREGIVTSTSAVVCDPAAARRLTYWRDQIRGCVGIHLQITDGLSLTGVQFPRFPSGIGNIDPDVLQREWEVQIAAFFECGLEPTHIDTHHHVHSIPAVFEVYRNLAGAYNLPARTLSRNMAAVLRAHGVDCADSGITWSAFSPRSVLEMAADFFGNASSGILEIGCHPAHADTALEAASVYAWPRQSELEMLCKPGLRSLATTLGIELCNYVDAFSACASQDLR